MPVTKWKMMGCAIAAGLCLTGCSSNKPSDPGAAKSATTALSQPPFLVYVSNETSGDVSVFDPVSQTVRATISVGKRPRGIHASADGKFIYVALSGSPPAPPGVDEDSLPPPDKSADGIGVIDVQQGKLARMIRCGSDPEQFDLSKDGKLIFVSNEDDGKMSIVDIERGTVLASFPVGGEPEGVRTSPDGTQVWVTSEGEGTVTAVDVVKQKVAGKLRTGRRPRSVAFTPSGDRAYVTNENDGTVTLVDAKSFTLIQQVRLGEPGKIKPMHVTMSGDGATVFASTGRGKKIFAIDSKTQEVRGSVDAGDRPWGLALSPDGRQLFAADGPRSELVVLDVEGLAVRKRIPAGSGPWGVAVAPSPSK